jgi:uncharacterized Rmd1/YagE family protein
LSAASEHEFHAVAFVQNLSPKEVAAHLDGAPPPSSRGRPVHDVRRPLGGGEVFYFAFGAVVFRDVAAANREAEVARLTQRHSLRAAADDMVLVHQDESGQVGVERGRLVIDRLTPGRSRVVALTLAQSAALEYYERIVDDMFGRTAAWVDRLEKRGTVALSVRPLHRFIAEAIGTRSEVIVVLHLLDKPEETWEDAVMDAIYDDLRDEFDLVDRHDALEHKLGSVQDSLQLVLDVARDRRLVLLEATIVVLIVLEIVLSFLRPH